MALFWNPSDTPNELHSMLETLAEEYPLKKSSSTGDLQFSRSESKNFLQVCRSEKRWKISYGRLCDAARGIAYALAEKEVSESNPFRSYGILFDCTRGNVITVKRFKFWLRRLALLGFNMAMIYTKDAYHLQDEPYFGYMRGAYSLEELQEIDTYARKLNIEMVASIQALGHLEPVLRWQAYASVRDTSNVILPDDPAAYALLEKMISFWSSAFSSRRIHLGMDETHDLGRGRFMDLNGYENPFDIYNRHLRKLCGICEKSNLSPIIWSDMYFRYGNKQRNYYDTSTVIPEDVKQAIPREVQLAYWDYYHRESDFYGKMLSLHTGLNDRMPFMASGVWTWARFWSDHEMTVNTVRPCIDGCKAAGVDELIYALWGDDGGYCSFESAIADLAWATDYAANGCEDEERTAGIFQAVCGTSYRDQLIPADLCYTGKNKKGELLKVGVNHLLWDDPLLGIIRHELPAIREDLPETLLEHFRNLKERISPLREDHLAGDMNYAWNVVNTAVLKMELRMRLENAYEKRDLHTLDLIAEKYIPEILDAIEGLLDAHRTQWLRSYKPFGIELMQIRLGGLSERYRELARCIDDLLDGMRDSIPELEEKPETIGALPYCYLHSATGNFFI